MNRLFVNDNGNAYCIVLGNIGQPALLVNMKSNQFVVCAILEKTSWWQGYYHDKFSDAYTTYKKIIGVSDESI